MDLSPPAPAQGRRAVARQALVLGIVSLSSPLALNMYVPAFPRMAAELGTDPAAIQLSLTSLLAALAVGQNIYGPLSDRFGRKGPLYFGLGLFMLASIAVAFTTSVETLVAWRFVQGLGACAAMAMPRAIVRDLYVGAEAARILALVTLVVSVAPLLAPMLGSALAALLSWRYIFWFMAFTAAVAALLLATMLPETLPPERRTGRGSGRLLGGYAALLRDPHFMGVSLMMSLTQAAFYAWLAGSPVVFMSLYGFEGWQFGLMYGFTAIFWAGSAQLAPAVLARAGAGRALVRCAMFNAFILVLLFAAGLASLAGPVPVVTAVILFYLGSGVMLPMATVEALRPHGALAGTASALMGTTAFAGGGLASALVSALADGTERPMLGVMAACALAALAFAWLAFGRRPGSRPPDEPR